METKWYFKKRYKVLLILIVLLSSTILWARYISTSGLVIREYKVTSNNLPKSFDGLKIVQFSDVHYGRTIGKRELEAIVKNINLLKPDLIFFTGDLIDRDTTLTPSMEKEIITILGQLKAVYGKYMVIGNHDIKFSAYSYIMDQSGFTSLNNIYDIIYSKSNEPIYLAGLESQVAGKPDINAITSYLNDKNNAVPKYKILLLHTPDTFDKVKQYDFDLVLAGHSHNGQIRLPFIGSIITPVGAKKYYKESYKIDSTQMYISGGLGTSVISYRFFDKPSYNFYRLAIK